MASPVRVLACPRLPVAAVPTVTALDGAPAEGYLIDVVPARPPSLSRDTMAFSAVTAAVSLRAPLATPRAPVASSIPSRAIPIIAASASRPSGSSATRLARRTAMSGEGSLALRLSSKTPGAAVRGKNAAAVRAMAKDEDSTAGISKKVARTSQACKTLGRWGFWGQLILSTVSAVILVFSFLFKGITKVRVRSSRSPRRSPRRARIPKFIVVDSTRSDG